MFKSLFRRSAPVVQAVDLREVIKTVEEIHREFLTASDIALAEANRILGNVDTNAVRKAERLKCLGFIRTGEVVSGEQQAQIRDQNKARAEVVAYYQQRYPMYKYISEEDVVRICRKYGLVCGTVDRFVGHVPDKNLTAIEQAHIDANDKVIRMKINSIEWWSRMDDSFKAWVERYLQQHYGGYFYVTRSEYHANSSAYLVYQLLDADFNKPGVLPKKWEKNNKWSTLMVSSANLSMEHAPLEICAPITDFNTQGMTLERNFLKPSSKPIEFSTAPVPDPVVLQRVTKGGFLIITAWGPEASDPLVQNPVHN